jgi:hypothetical protein
MIGGSFYPETIGLANLAALNSRSAPGMLTRLTSTAPESPFAAVSFPGLNSAYLKLFWVF